jgi:hypothetical protein
VKAVDEDGEVYTEYVQSKCGRCERRRGLTDRRRTMRFTQNPRTHDLDHGIGAGLNAFRDLGQGVLRSRRRGLGPLLNLIEAVRAHPAASLA